MPTAPPMRATAAVRVTAASARQCAVLCGGSSTTPTRMMIQSMAETNTCVASEGMQWSPRRGAGSRVVGVVAGAGSDATCNESSSSIRQYEPWQCWNCRHFMATVEAELVLA
eukprot:6143823-Prymnesium_polylepis.1